MAQYFSLANGNINDPNIFGLSLSSGEIMNNTTGVNVLTSYLYTPISVMDKQYVLSAIAVNLSALDITKADSDKLDVIVQQTSSPYTILDNTSAAIQITNTNGTVYQSNFSPYSPNGWSVYLLTSNIKVSPSSNFTFLHNTNAKWTIDFWINNQGLGNRTILDTGGFNSLSAGINLNKTASENLNLQIYCLSGSSNFVVNATSTTTLLTGVWTHVAVTYDYSLPSNNVVFYFNGIQGGTGNKTANIPTNRTPHSVLNIASHVNSSNAVTSYLSGYLSNLRIIDNQILYNGDFNPPTSAFGLSSIGSTGVNVVPTLTGTVALQTFQNNRLVDNSPYANTITDSNTSIHQINPFNNIIHDPNVHGGSIKFSGANRLTTLNNPRLNFGTGDFTAEYWIYNIENRNSGLIGQTDAQQNNGFIMYRDHTSSFAATFRIAVAGVRTDYYSGVPDLFKWTHIAFCRSGTTLRTFKNGVLINTYTSSLNITDSTITILGYADVWVYYDNSYYTDIRLSREALYTSSFPLSTVQFTRPLSSLASTGILINANNLHNTTVTTNQSYPLSSFSKYDASNNYFSTNPQNWQILKLSTPLTAKNTDNILIGLKTNTNNNNIKLVSDNRLSAIDSINKNNITVTTGGSLILSSVVFSNVNDYGFILNNGTNNWLTIPANPTLYDFINDFTIQFWINTSTFTIDAGIYRRVLSFGADAVNNLSLVFVNAANNAAANTLMVYSNTMLISGTSAVADGNWHHVALSRKSGLLKLFVDGKQSGNSRITTQNFNAGSTNILSIGTYNNTATGRLSGCIYNFNIVKDLALYTDSFDLSSVSLSSSIYSVLNLKAGYNFNKAIIAYPSFLSPLTDNNATVHIGGCLNGFNLEQTSVSTVSSRTYANVFVHNQGFLNFPFNQTTTLTVTGFSGLHVTSDGTVNMGTSSLPISGSVSANIILSGNGLYVHNGGNLNINGNYKIPYAYLQNDVSIANNLITSNSNLSSNWLSGDNIILTCNISSLPSFDSLILSAFLSDKSFITSTNTLCSHNVLSTIPTIYNLTRSAKLRGLDNVTKGFIACNDNAKLNINNAQFSNFGNTALNKSAIVSETILSGYVVLSGCTFENTTNIFCITANSGNLSAFNNTFYKNLSFGLNFDKLSASNVTFSNNSILSVLGIGINYFNLSSSNNTNINFYKNYIIGGNTIGTYIQNCVYTNLGEIVNFNTQGVTISGYNKIDKIYNLENYYSRQHGIYVDTFNPIISGTLFTNITSNNNISAGIVLSGNNLNYITPFKVNFNNVNCSNNGDSGFKLYNIYGNLTGLIANYNYQYGIETSIGNGPTIFNNVISIMGNYNRKANTNVISFVILSGYNYNETVISNAYLSASSTLNSAALSLESTRFNDFSLENSELIGNTTGFELKATRNIIEGSYNINNSKTGSTPVGSSGLSNVYQPSNARSIGFAHTNFNRVNGYNITYTNIGQRITDSVIFNGDNAQPSEKLIPLSTRIKFKSGSKFVALDNGQFTTIKVYVRIDSTYNGSSPRLILKSNPSVGILSNIVLNTFNLNTRNAFVLAQANTPSITNDGVLEFYIDCDGTQGFINIDDWDAI